MFCKNTSITTNTSAMASARVFTTSSMEMRTNFDVSKGMAQATPSGMYCCSSVMRARTALAVASALPVGESCTPMPVEVTPFSRDEVA